MCINVEISYCAHLYTSYIAKMCFNFYLISVISVYKISSLYKSHIYRMLAIWPNDVNKKFEDTKLFIYKVNIILV